MMTSFKVLFHSFLDSGVLESEMEIEGEAKSWQ